MSGCYGSELSEFHTTSFLINGSLLLDAGTVASVLTLDEQMEINHVILSHSHLDHTKDIFFLADNINIESNKSIEVISIHTVIETLRSHLLNFKIWPDFTVLPTTQKPVLKFKSIEAYQDFSIDGLTLKPIPVNHTVDAVGYIIRDKKSSILYTGDTGPTDRIWEEANRFPNLKAVIVETSFPNHLQRLAEQSGHLTPLMLKKQLDKLKNFHGFVLIFHMKPQYLCQLKDEIVKLKNSNIMLLKQGEVFEF